MLFISGTKRSGTSMWMQVMRAAGLPILGEAFPRNWGTFIRDANPEGFFESFYREGIYWRTNPHPTKGTYLASADVAGYACKVFVPGVFRSYHGARAVKCALKSSDGVLYPLNKSLFFLPKPTTFIRLDEIVAVEFLRMERTADSMNRRTFDMTVTTKGGHGAGSDDDQDFNFSAIDRNEYKRHQAAIVLKVSPRTFGRGRPMPLALRWAPPSD